MADIPQTDVSRPSALPTANLLPRSGQQIVDQNSDEYLEAIEEEWNKKVDVEVDTLVDGMVDLVGLASVSRQLLLLGFPVAYDAAAAVTRRSGTRTSFVWRRSRFKPSVVQSRW